MVFSFVSWGKAYDSNTFPRRHKSAYRNNFYSDQEIVCRHHGFPFEDQPETPRTSRQYVWGGFEGAAELSPVCLRGVSVSKDKWKIFQSGLWSRSILSFTSQQNKNLPAKLSQSVNKTLPMFTVLVYHVFWQVVMIHDIICTLYTATTRRLLAWCDSKIWCTHWNFFANNETFKLVIAMLVN